MEWTKFEVGYREDEGTGAESVRDESQGREDEVEGIVTVCMGKGGAVEDAWGSTLSAGVSSEASGWASSGVSSCEMSSGAAGSPDASAANKDAFVAAAAAFFASRACRFFDAASLLSGPFGTPVAA